MTGFMNIDGSQGEGGGQILRTALALSIVTRTPIHIERIRAGRKRPGLLRQHLTAVLAAAEICRANVEGAALTSGELWFSPGPVRGGDYRFQVGTAGSACLVFQTVLPALLTASGRSRVVFEGGTHNPMSPPMDFIILSFLPQLARMGASVRVQLERPGFYPAGGGRFVASIEPWPERIALELTERGELREMRARAILAQIRRDIGVRELRVIRDELGLSGEQCAIRFIDNSLGPGNVVLCELEYEQVTTVVCAFGERGVRAESVARRAAREVCDYLAHSAPVDQHLADQLMLPMALAGGGRYTTISLTPHARTNRDIICAFLDIDIDAAPHGDDVMITMART